jgi:hypothetical protein
MGNNAKISDILHVRNPRFIPVIREAKVA